MTNALSELSPLLRRQSFKIKMSFDELSFSNYLRRTNRDEQTQN